MQAVQKLVTALADPKKLVGKKIVDQATGAPNDVVRSELPSGTRVIRPGMAVTMDYRPQRLNLNVDASGVVKSYHYG